MTNDVMVKSPDGLADRFKTRTWDLHQEAETTGFINQILRGTAALPHYISFLQNLKPVYDAMESSRDWLSSFPQMAPYMGEGIARAQTLSHDIEHLMARSTQPSCPAIFASTQNYCAHIQSALSDNHPAMLAHIYVRYLGDLNGGLVLQRLLAKHLDLPAECLTFYSFPKIDDLQSFKSDFREVLNSLSLNADDEASAIEAARDAFRFNIALSNLLAD